MDSRLEMRIEVLEQDQQEQQEKNEALELQITRLEILVRSMDQEVLDGRHRIDALEELNNNA